MRMSDITSCAAALRFDSLPGVEAHVAVAIMDIGESNTGMLSWGTLKDDRSIVDNARGPKQDCRI